MRGRILILSCVGGGPMQRLADRLTALHRPAEVVSRYDPQRWRSLMAAGRLGRVRARLGAFLLFPIQALHTVMKKDVSAIVVTTNPFYLPLLLVASRLLHRQPVIALVYDLYPEAFQLGRQSRWKRFLAGPAAAANRYWLRNVQGAVFIGPSMAAYSHEAYGEPERWAVFETGADAEEFSLSALGPNEPLTELEAWCADRVVLSYIGNLGQVHDWETLSEAVPAAIRETACCAGVVVAGSGPGIDRWREAWRNANEIRFEEPLSDDAWARLLSRSAVALVTLKKDAAHTSIPSKTFSAMAAGNAILAIAPDRSDLAALVRRHDCGRVVAPGDVGTATAAMKELIANPAMRERYSANSLEAARNHYDIRCLAEAWAGFLDEVEAPAEGSRAAFPERMRDRQHESGYGRSRTKRVLDMIGAGAALLLLSPALLTTAAMIRTFMGAPVLFRQERAGLDGRPFRLLKFRSMSDARDASGALLPDAERVTRLGRFLRRCSLDELPSLINVLAGDMSLVGPRPLLVRYLSRYSPTQRLRQEVRPGITGWSQINGRNALPWEERLDLDVWYVENASLLLDLKILVLTVIRVLQRTGVTPPDKFTMPEFFGSEVPQSAETSTQEDKD